MSSNRNSELVTKNLRVRAAAEFLPERSDVSRHAFIFQYRISIANEGSEPVQLLSRHWVIINADGDREEVQGDGVVGETPLLAAGESFSYSSYCPLSTHWGTMEGEYTMKNSHGEHFQIGIGRFYLVDTSDVDSELVQ